jgi:hypothetical protein
MSFTSTADYASDWRWLRGPEFDLVFVLGILALAVVTSAAVVMNPSLFYPILIVDLWLLGYHHVISTYTRLCFDKQSFMESRFLVLGVFPLILGVTALAAWTFGIWIVITVYFYWQWWHYTRQSWGISRAYRGKDANALYESGWLDQAIFYSLPVVGILWRSYQDPGVFLGMEIRVFPVIRELVDVAAIAAAALIAFWLFRRMQAWWQGKLALAHTLYMSTHFLIFATGYFFISDISYGWLAINIWHNAQYILFVWLFNTRRFRNGIDPSARFLSLISQPERKFLYFGTCIAVTGILYFSILGTLDALFFAGLSATLVLYQAVNFHHYIVDSFIWKIRKEPIRKTLGIDG